MAENYVGMRENWRGKWKKVIGPTSLAKVQSYERTLLHSGMWRFEIWPEQKWKLWVQGIGSEADDLALEPVVAGGPFRRKAPKGRTASRKLRRAGYR